ncbi:MAG: iduronate-2-sulfatase [Saprospiraceae bacterium]|nr:MAG: iduronate-2-sulfatase [Saprospiraceae bacterium]
MKKIDLLILSFSIGCFLNPVLAQEANIQEVPTNVLVIIADDLSTTLNCYGAEGVITPNLDKLAERGRKFERAYCQASLCNPSRASIMTGRRPNKLKVWTNNPHFRGIHPKIETLPQHFKNNGYHSVGIGKIFHNWGQSMHGDEPSWSAPEAYHWAAHYQDWYVPGRPYQIHEDLKKGPAVQCEEVPDEAYLDGRITNLAINKLRELQETPFFLAVGFWKPHLPYNAPKKYWDLYDRNALPAMRYPGPAHGVPEVAYVNSNEARSYTDIDKTGPIPAEKKLELRHGYLAAISYLDAQVGKIIDELDRLGLSENTIIVFMSDHGYHAGEHGQFGKWTNFELGTRVPFIIATPDMAEPGKASNSIVELVDLYPTLVELCNLPPPNEAKKLAGVSLVPILKKPDSPIKSKAISQITRPLNAGPDFDIIGSTIREEHFRYTVWTNREDGHVIAEELYDLSTDLFNANNLSNDPKYSKRKEKLYQQLHENLK